MDFNLQILNLFVGLLKGDPDLPNDLMALGYQCVAIEPSFDNGAGGLVKPELLAASTLESHTVLFEWKSGGNVEDEQAMRYAAVTQGSLISNAGLQPVQCATYDVAYAAPGEAAAKAAGALTKMTHPFPVLRASDTTVSLESGAFKSASLTACFSPALECGLDHAPLGYVPCWLDSPDHVLADLAVPTILLAMKENSAHITVPTIAAGILPIWNELDDQGMKTKLVKRIHNILTKASELELNEFIGTDKRNGTRRVLIRANPFHLRGRDRGDALRRLQKKQQDLLRRLDDEARGTRQLSLDIGEHD